MVTTKPRVLVLFGGIPLYGQERGNIEAVRAAKEAGLIDALFVTNERWGHLNIQPELTELCLDWTVAPYCGKFEKGMGWQRWLQSFMIILRASWRLIRIVRSFQPTHIHVFNPLYFLNFLPYLMFTRLPIIYRLGDQPTLHNLFYKALWKFFILQKVSAFVCNSRFIQEGLLDSGVPLKKIRLIYSSPAIRKKIQSKESRLALSKKGLVFCYIGQITADKGVDILVDAARRVLVDYPVMTFLFVGDYSWNNAFAESLISSVKKDHLEESIRFLGYRTDVDVLLEQSDVHVCPSVWAEALANVVLEAKRAGRPSIIFPSGGLPELVEHGVDGYICPEKTEYALADAIRYYIAQPEQIRQHGAAAFRSLEEKFEISSFSEKWAQVYNDVEC